MRDELKDILLNVGKWCDKYSKDYLSIAFVNGTLMSNLDTKDADYTETDMTLNYEKEVER